MTIVTLTRLLAISIVARSRSGLRTRSSALLPRGVSSSSSHCSGVSEKNAISLPDTKPEINRAPTATIRAMIWSRPKLAGKLSCKADTTAPSESAMAGKGSISKTYYIGFTSKLLRCRCGPSCAAASSRRKVSHFPASLQIRTPSALFPHTFRTPSALFPHTIRTLPHTIRTFSAHFPHTRLQF